MPEGHREFDESQPTEVLEGASERSLVPRTEADCWVREGAGGCGEGRVAGDVAGFYFQMMNMVRNLAEGLEP